MENQQSKTCKESNFEVFLKTILMWICSFQKKKQKQWSSFYSSVEESIRDRDYGDKCLIIVRVYRYQAEAFQISTVSKK